MSSLNKSQQRQAILIFEMLDEIADAGKAAWLEQECIGEPEIFQYVQTLMAVEAEEEAASLTGHFTRSPTTTADPDFVGPYRIIRQLGEGGMGLVYLAERVDGSFDRTVAIKFVRDVGIGTQGVARFHTERAILAAMEHTNIARLIDGGDINNRPYLVMEYVEGTPFKFDGLIPRKTQLRRFCKVCSAVSYAHTKLVLHRDIKPSNILIDAHGEPKLLDFGVAKINTELSQADVGLTGILGIPVTMNYCPPEYFAGEPANIAGDIYSLGVLLYELVHGELPCNLSGMTSPQAHQAIMSKNIGTLTSGSHDLDLIIQQSLHNDPNRRYVSADALLQDINNNLENRPIRARADEFGYVVHQFVKRNALAVGLTAITLLVVLGAVIATTMAYVESEKSRRLAEQQISTAEATISFLSDTLGQASPDQNLEKDLTLSAALRIAESGLSTHTENDPTASAVIQTTFARIFANRGEIDRARHYANGVLELFASHPQDLDPWKARLFEDLIEVYFNSSEFETAFALTEEVDAALKSTADRNWVSIAINLNIMSQILIGQSKLDEATRVANEIEKINKTEQELPRFEIARMRYNLASALLSAGRAEDTVSHSKYVFDYLYEDNLENSFYGFRGRNAWGLTLGSVGRFEESVQILDEVIADMQVALEPHHQMMLEGVTHLAETHANSGNPEKAIEILEPYLLTIESSRPDIDDSSAYLIMKLGSIMCSANRSDEGLRLIQKSLSVHLTLFEPNHWRVLENEAVMGYCLIHLERYNEAEKLIRHNTAQWINKRGKNSSAAQRGKYWLTKITVARDKAANALVD